MENYRIPTWSVAPKRVRQGFCRGHSQPVVRTRRSRTKVQGRNRSLQDGQHVELWELSTEWTSGWERAREASWAEAPRIHGPQSRCGIVWPQPSIPISQRTHGQMGNTWLTACSLTKYCTQSSAPPHSLSTSPPGLCWAQGTFTQGGGSSACARYRIYCAGRNSAPPSEAHWRPVGRMDPQVTVWFAQD